MLQSALAALNAGDAERALALCRKAAAADPASLDAWRLAAFALVTLGRQEEALAAFDQALTLAPDDADTLSNQACALHDLHRHEAALAACDRALAAQPDHAAAHFNRGLALENLERRGEALAAFEAATAHSATPYPEAMAHRASMLLALERFEAALDAAQAFLRQWPDNADLWWVQGAAARWLGRTEEALAYFTRALEIAPRHPDAFNGAAVLAMARCDWEALARLKARFEQDPSIILPFPGLAMVLSGDPAVHLQCAANHVKAMAAQWPQPLPPRSKAPGDRIRIAYLSADFRQHPVGYLFLDVLARHDRARFEVHGVSFGVDDGGSVRSALVEGFDGFHDVAAMGDQEAARLVASLQADIAVDMMGHTFQARPGILAARPAPVQASFMGFPGTTGAEFIDYILADEVVLPFDQQPHYSETIVHLPGCYLPGTSPRKRSERRLDRHSMGLPERGFVFCCFNAPWKIAPDVFALWMDLLRQVEGSVLWLSGGPADDNLRRRAAALGVDPSRLVFKQRLPFDEHLAAHDLADLFLDTLPYNAHATAADALWAGLPVLTRKGGTFAGRVAASILEAAGLPELVAAGEAEYRALALGLARDPARMASIRQALAEKQPSMFDGETYVRGLEAAFETMHGRWLKGEPATNFTVPGPPRRRGGSPAGSAPPPG